MTSGGRASRPSGNIKNSRMIARPPSGHEDRLTISAYSAGPTAGVPVATVGESSVEWRLGQAMAASSQPTG